jgi:hypothetical protein
MKKILGLAVLLGFLGISSPSSAQDTTKKDGTVTKAWKGTKKGVKKGWKATKKGAKVAGDETAETATKVKAKVTDKKSDEWVGPNGQTIYVDDASKYYWINGSGKRIFVSQSALKAKQH